MLKGSAVPFIRHSMGPPHGQRELLVGEAWELMNGSPQWNPTPPAPQPRRQCPLSSGGRSSAGLGGVGWAGGQGAAGEGPCAVPGTVGDCLTFWKGSSGTLNQGVSMPVCLSIMSFMLILFYCLGMDVHGKCLVLIDYVVRRGLNNKGLQKLSRAPPGLIQ